MRKNEEFLLRKKIRSIIKEAIEENGFLFVKNKFLTDYAANRLASGENTMTNAAGKEVDTQQHLQDALAQGKRVKEHLIRQYASKPFVFKTHNHLGDTLITSFQVRDIAGLDGDFIFLVGDWNNQERRKIRVDCRRGNVSYYNGQLRKYVPMSYYTKTKSEWEEFMDELVFISNYYPRNNRLH